MASLSPDNLHTCTVKLSIDNTHGTGFFVATGLILTCHHVVKNAGDRPIKVRWQNRENFAEAKVLQSFPDPVDLALLQFETVETLACVELDGAIAAFDNLFAYGYPDNDSNGTGVPFRCDGFNGDVPPKIKFSDNRVRPGLSGAPLLNPATGKVCGVVKYTEDRSLPLGGGGIPIATVLEYFPFLNTSSPYKGLAYFKDNDARFFFGRTALTDLLLNRLQQSNFLALLGASGSGKSSVLRAGLLNQLRLGRLSGSERWELRVMLPTEHPLKSLANEFVDQKLGNIDRAAQLKTAEKLLNEGKDGLRRLVETSKAPRVVLVIDQFEESFTLCQSADIEENKKYLQEREQFFAALIRALELPKEKFCLVMSMRADFFGKCVEREYGGLSKRIAAHLVPVTPMSASELQEAITKPAEIVGCEVEPILIEEIVRDVAGAPANLPLMQFALSELWQLRDGNRLTLQAYKKELGGITGALEKRANAVYAQFTDELDKRAVKHIFLSLTQLGEGTEDTRRRVVMSNLVTATLSLEAIERVVRKLADEKLVVTDDRDKGKVSGDAIVDVAHEALIRGWRLLRGWLDEDRQNLLQRQWIEDRAIEWQRARNDEDTRRRNTVEKLFRHWLGENYQNLRKRNWLENHVMNVWGTGKSQEYLLSGRKLKEAVKFKLEKVDRHQLSNPAQLFLKESESWQVVVSRFVAIVYILIPIILGGFSIHWWYLETKWAVLRHCEKEQSKDGKCAGRIEALNTLIQNQVSLQAINLSGADLSGADLSGVRLSEGNLKGADLSNANLKGVNLSRAYLNGANFSNANLSNANLEGAYLSDANLYKTDLREAYLNNINLERANLSNANLRKAKLNGSNLINANLNNSDLSKANLEGANLKGANLNRSDLFGSDLSKANLSIANLSNSNLWGAKLFETNLIGANLNRADFSYANLSKAEFFAANLNGANLNNVVFINIETIEEYIDADMNLPLNSPLNYPITRSRNVKKEYKPDKIKTACYWEKAITSKELKELLKKVPNPKYKSDLKPKTSGIKLSVIGEVPNLNEKPDCNKWNK